MKITDTFLLSLVWIIYVYFGYPAAIAVIGRRRHARPRSVESFTPLVSVLIAARNEAQDIGWKIEETLAWDYPPSKLEILVASDASDDATDTIVRRYAGSRVTLLRMDRRGGKARALNRLAKIAKGDIFFFTDANAHIGPQALRRMTRHLADPRVGCVTGDSRSIAEEAAAVADGASVYWSYETILKQLESRAGSVLVCDGAIFCVRASLFRPLDPELANDLESPMRVGADGHWIVHEPDALVFERDTSSPLEEFRRRRRMCAQGMLAMFRLPGAFRGLRGWQFVSHKLLRWLTLIPLLMLLLSSTILARRSTAFIALFAIQLAGYLLAAIGLAGTMAQRSVPRVCAVPFYALLGFVGALTGVVECLAGKRFDVWEIPVLSRGPASPVRRFS
jgi:cellulose synthase/poly-beta-1,6-N-acetylglucosamine synthase-like glycosyltransferase